MAYDLTITIHAENGYDGKDQHIKISYDYSDEDGGWGEKTFSSEILFDKEFRRCREMSAKDIIDPVLNQLHKFFDGASHYEDQFWNV